MEVDITGFPEESSSGHYLLCIQKKVHVNIYVCSEKSTSGYICLFSRKLKWTLRSVLYVGTLDFENTIKNRFSLLPILPRPFYFRRLLKGTNRILCISEDIFERKHCFVGINISSQRLRRKEWASHADFSCAHWPLQTVVQHIGHCRL